MEFIKMVFILVSIKKKSPATPSHGSVSPLPGTSGTQAMKKAPPSKSPSPAPSTSKASTAKESGMPTATERRKAAAAARKKKMLVLEF